MTTQKPSTAKVFTVFLFTDMFENPSLIYKNIASSQRHRYLINRWMQVREQLNTAESGRALDCEEVRLASGAFLYIIRLAQPKVMDEPYYIGLVFQVEKGLFKTSVMSARFFMLESANTYTTKGNGWRFVEIIQGPDIKSLGFMVDCRIETFRRGVEQIIARIPLDVLIIEKSEEQPVEPVINMRTTNMVDPEEKFGEIWEKWGDHPVSQADLSTIEEFTLPLEKFLSNLARLCFQYEVIPWSEAEKTGESIGYFLGRIARGSFLIGLEYGSQDTDLSKFLQNKDLQALFQTAAEPANSFISSRTQELLDKGVFSSFQVDKMTTEVASLINDICSECWQIGANNTSRIKSNESTVSPPQKDVSTRQKLLGQVAEKAFYDPDPEVRSEAQQSVKSLFPGGEQGFLEFVNKMIEGLRDPSKQQFAVTALIPFGDLVVPYITPLMNDSNPSVRKSAIFILTSIEQMKNSPSKR